MHTYMCMCLYVSKGKYIYIYIYIYSYFIVTYYAPSNFLFMLLSTRDLDLIYLMAKPLYSCYLNVAFHICSFSGRKFYMAKIKYRWIEFLLNGLMQPPQ